MKRQGYYAKNIAKGNMYIMKNERYHTKVIIMKEERKIK